MRISATSCSGRIQQAAFTLTEVLVSGTLFVMLMGGFLAAHLFGARLYEMSKVKLSLTDATPRIFNQLADDIRSAKVLQVGKGSSNSFVPASLSAARMGNALQLSPSKTGQPSIRYFLDSNDLKLKRLNEDGAVTLIAESITNTLVFSIVNRFNQVLTNEQPRKIIQVDLASSVNKTNGTPYGLGNNSGHYRLTTKIAARASE
jgi:hypothetical protein